ncbi:hypothetical protein HIJ39_12180 [Sulfobacillus sp. DSM 109850]|uniref:Uncharacterized protein n=1 Tax=Sulfobacillus harzensis TaxID=2729629 RepID=A0A7Y0L4T8_9FIRM|nr:hypothetical protein [Sulfobacillus harzensis]
MFSFSRPREYPRELTPSDWRRFANAFLQLWLAVLMHHPFRPDNRAERHRNRYKRQGEGGICRLKRYRMSRSLIAWIGCRQRSTLHVWWPAYRPGAYLSSMNSSWRAR